MFSLRRSRISKRLFPLLALALVASLVPTFVRTPGADAQTSPVIISEFLAVNDSTLADNTGDFSDWIELHNPTGSAIDLGGWTIADGGEAFVFSAGTTVQPQQYRVFFASGDLTRSTAAEVHLPFRLSGSGESLTLTEPDGTLSSPAWPAPQTYPAQLADDSYGVASGGQLRFFTNPTPGSANGGGVGGVVEPVDFSIEHGFYESTQSLVLSSSTPGATIRYTTNGDVPTSSSGTALASGGSVTIDATTTIRAVAFRDGWIDSPVESRSYLFTADIIDQGRPAAWPSGPVNGQQLDFGMDDNVVSGNEAAVRSSLTGIPSISIVTDQDNLFDATTGIYVNADQRGSEWERQAGVELIDPTGAEAGFDIEAGLRIRGGFSRNDANAKHAFRLYFRDSYEQELDYPLFGDEGVSDFEIMDLRSASNYAWSWRHTRTATFIEELWSRDTQAAMGQPYTRSRPYHLYLNGTYWGLYMSQERVSAEYGETYFEGTEDDFDVMKRNAPDRDTEAGDGTADAWNSLFDLVSDLQVDDTEFAQIAADVDLVNLADYYLLHFWTGDFDGAPSWFFRLDGDRWVASNNWFALRNRNGVGAAAKWQFFDHDSEHSLCADGGPGLDENIDNLPPWNLKASLGVTYMAPSWLHEALVTHPTYRQIFADRIQQHMLTPGGALTVPEALARFEARATEISPAIEAESARWGDGGGEPAYGRSDWEFGLQLKRDCFALRAQIAETQLRQDGLWPLTDPPGIDPNGGGVAFGTAVTITDTGAGTVYLTTDGSDPRAGDGSVSTSAIAYSGPFQVASDLTVRARILDGAEWSPLAQADFVLTTPAGPVSLALNEFNAVSGSRFLGGGDAADIANGTDATLGRVLGNGGDWFELAVVQDRLDVRGWTFELWNNPDGVAQRTASLTLGDAAVLGDLRAGSLITISESIPDDISYNPIQGDWHLNLQANNNLDGSFVTAATQTNFAIDNDDTQIAIFDAAGLPVQLRTGEGTVPGVSVNSTEVFKLEGVPTFDLGSNSALYADGTSSTWGLPNVFDGGASVQDLASLRIDFGDVNCDGFLDIIDALVVAQADVGLRATAASCPLADPSREIYGAAADVDDSGTIDIIDALLIAQCTVGLPNALCPADSP